MSASLVGSEMCIRDRVVGVGVVDVGVVGGVGVVGVGNVGFGVVGVAVSYTHLTLPTICSV
eukprot:9858054-Alexandrium_andersonii.AAC.1